MHTCREAYACGNSGLKRGVTNFALLSSAGLLLSVVDSNVNPQLNRENKERDGWVRERKNQWELGVQGHMSDKSWHTRVFSPDEAAQVFTESAHGGKKAEVLRAETFENKVTGERKNIIFRVPIPKSKKGAQLYELVQPKIKDKNLESTDSWLYGCALLRMMSANPSTFPELKKAIAELINLGETVAEVLQQSATYTNNGKICMSPTSISHCYSFFLRYLHPSLAANDKKETKNALKRILRLQAKLNSAERSSLLPLISMLLDVAKPSDSTAASVSTQWLGSILCLGYREAKNGKVSELKKENSPAQGDLYDALTISLLQQERLKKAETQSFDYVLSGIHRSLAEVASALKFEAVNAHWSAGESAKGRAVDAAGKVSVAMQALAAMLARYDKKSLVFVEDATLKIPQVTQSLKDWGAEFEIMLTKARLSLFLLERVWSAVDQSKSSINKLMSGEIDERSNSPQGAFCEVSPLAYRWWVDNLVFHLKTVLKKKIGGEKILRDVCDAHGYSNVLATIEQPKDYEWLRLVGSHQKIAAMKAEMSRHPIEGDTLHALFTGTQVQNFLVLVNDNGVPQLKRVKKVPTYQHGDLLTKA